MAGYSGTPLSKKLGVGEGCELYVRSEPAGYTTLLEPLPAGVRFATRLTRSVNIAHVFSARRADLQRALAQFRKTLEPDATVWVSWPKKASRVATDITEDTVRELALPLGFVDVKVCAIDDVWSGLKLVVRKELRSTAR